MPYKINIVTTALIY